MIDLTVEQKEILEQFVRRRNTPQWLAKRSQILLHLFAGLSIKATARKLNCSPKTVRRWLRRWNQNAPQLMEMMDRAAGDKLEVIIADMLSDEPRIGRPPVFSPEEVVQIVVIACEDPQKYNRPISHWTPTELADEVTKQSIVKRISPRSVGRFLKGVESQTSSVPLLAQPQH